MPDAAKMLAAFRSQLEPGDILVATPKHGVTGTAAQRAMGKAFAGISSYLQNSEKTHSMIYTGGGKVVETRIEQGVTHKPLATAIHGLDVVAVRPTVVPEKERREAARRALKMVKEQPAYAFKGLVKAVLEDQDVRLDVGKVDGIICSDLITRSYKSRLTDKPVDAVMPVDFLRSTRLAHVSEYKGRAHAAAQR